MSNLFGLVNGKLIGEAPLYVYSNPKNLRPILLVINIPSPDAI